MSITVTLAIRGGLGIGFLAAFMPIVGMPNMLPGDGRIVVIELRFEHVVEKPIIVAIGIVATGIAVANKFINTAMLDLDLKLIGKAL
jgi:hypothetical protein